MQEPDEVKISRPDLKTRVNPTLSLTFLRDAFGTLACTDTQEYNFFVARTWKTFAKICDVWDREAPYVFDLTVLNIYKEIICNTNPRMEKRIEKILKKTTFSSRLPFSFQDYYNFNDTMKVNFYSLNKKLTEVSQGSKIYNLKPEMFKTIKDREFKAETRILPTFRYIWFFKTDVFRVQAQVTVVGNKNESKKRTQEVLEKEAERVTPMKPLW